MAIEKLKGIKGSFDGKIVKHPDPTKTRRALAEGHVTYPRTQGDVTQEVQVPVSGVRVRRFNDAGNGDFRRYIRISRGSRPMRDTIIGIIDQE